MAKKIPTPAKSPEKGKEKPELPPKKPTVTPKAPVSKTAPLASVKKEKSSDTAASAAAAKASSREDLRSRVLARTKVSRPIAFSLDEVREIAKTIEVKTEGGNGESKAKLQSNGKKDLGAVALPVQPNHIRAASLADILGFNPKQKANPTVENEEDIPERFRRYYKLLIELRDHVTGQLDQHTEETLKRSAKDDAGDLSSYGQHMADAGTDTFDRDFALSLVSNEQEALSEIDAAIQRIKAGTYGMCEASGKPIPKERLIAVPFTRYTAEAQKDIEKNRYRSRQQAGLFGEFGEDNTKIADEEAGGED